MNTNLENTETNNTTTDDKNLIEENARKEKVKTIVEDIKEINIEEIDNPFELILLLIDKANSLKEEKVDILDFHLADITSDYIKIMEHAKFTDMEISADFILITATLLKIKSEMILPKPDIEEGDEEENIETKILKATKEYEIFRNAALTLSQQENFNKNYREPAPLSKSYKIVLKDMSINNLVKVFAKTLEKMMLKENAPIQTIVKDRWTVEDKIFEIETLLFNKNRIQFFELIEDDYTRGEIINLFLALLELVKRDVISIQQNEIYGDITIYKINHSQDEFEEYNYTEEFEEE